MAQSKENEKKLKSMEAEMIPLQEVFHAQGDNRKYFFDAIEYLKDPWNQEKLQHLLSFESWKRFVAAAKLSRDKADALYADLSQLETFMAMEDQEHLESFMKEFPQVKQDLKDRIRKLYVLADEVDKVHKDCTITQVAAASTGAASGLLSIAGLCLAPFTAGASMALLATGVGLGAASAVTGVTANIVDMSKDASAKAEASRLVSTGSDTVNEVLHHSIGEIASLAWECCQSLLAIVEGSNVLKVAERSAISATRFLRKGAVSARTYKQLHKALKGTVVATSKGARVFDAATAGVFFIGDVVDLVNESKHLHEGAKAESAEELRQQAQELERRLEELTCIHGSLHPQTVQGAG
ncbi:apolipoprotein L3-like [Eptesicus fuscus]|uniref:apolipoprotein L3-like n=1 Tax=Eptesicus fuscus TaxID=29078 RepID=UPI0024040FD4|nr:apolipoprotein L3-like [Eptesicus fuscus]